MWLDLGCGGSPRGDVNLDLFQGTSPHTVQIIDPKLINNFTSGSAEYLPYKDNSFWVVSGYHLIEHLLEPTKCLVDMTRVAKKYLIIGVPNHPLMREHHNHYYSWSKQSLETLLGEYGEIVYSVTRMMWWNSDKMLKVIAKLPFLVLRRLAYHTLNFLFGTEIIVIVDVSGNI